MIRRGFKPLKQVEHPNIVRFTVAGHLREWGQPMPALGKLSMPEVKEEIKEEIAAQMCDAQDGQMDVSSIDGSWLATPIGKRSRILGPKGIGTITMPPTLFLFLQKGGEGDEGRLLAKHK